MRNQSLYNFDVIFLLLSSCRLARFEEFLALHDQTFNMGFHTAIATQPAQIASSARRLRVIVVDGSENDHFDVCDVIKNLRRLNNIEIIFLADNERIPVECIFEAGADVCLRKLVNPNVFCRVLLKLTQKKLAAVTATDGNRAKPG